MTLKISQCTLHFDPLDLYQKHDFKLLMEKLALFSSVICLNESQKNILSDYIENPVVIEHGLDKDVEWNIEKTNKNKSGRISIGIVSKRYSDGRKGERYLLKLASKLDIKKFDFIFVGSGWRSLALQLMVMGFVVAIKGKEKYINFPSLYRNIDVIYIGSLFEGGPACLQEAVGSRTWLFSNMVGVLQDYVIDGLSGEVITFDIDKDIKNLLVVRKKILNGEKPVFKKEVISWEDNFKSHLALYSGLL